MSLTSKMGTKYIFCSENETYKLKGFHGDFISWDEVDPRESEDKDYEIFTAEKD